MFTKRSLFLTKHARRVLITKRTLPVFAFLLAALLIAWPLLTPEKERFDLPIQTTKNATPSVDMEQVRFFAQDDKQRTMMVTALSVKEIEHTKQLARLDKPHGVYTLADGDILTSDTEDGLVYQNEKYFFFEKPIKTVSKSGYTANSSHVKATYEGIISSDYPVEISGPSGTLKAEGILLQNKGTLIHFNGQTHSTIRQDNGLIIVDTEDGLVIDRVKKTVTGKKNVRIKQQENLLTSDTIILYYTEDKAARVQNITAAGHVVLDNGQNKITGDTGDYNPITEEILMTGNVRLYQGKSYVEGEKATLNMKTGESRLLNKKTGRVRGSLLAEDIKQGKIK